jgi:hypothetical protein
MAAQLLFCVLYKVHLSLFFSDAVWRERGCGLWGCMYIYFPGQWMLHALIWCNAVMVLCTTKC